MFFCQTTPPLLLLQEYHPPATPAQVLQNLQQHCPDDVEWDVYGDFHRDDSSFLRRFEARLATELGQPDAVFMPSGVMAQSIALLIHKQARQGGMNRPKFACHHTSHLLLHEQEAYRELLGMKPVVLSTIPDREPSLNPLSEFLPVPPLRFQDICNALDRSVDNDTSDVEKIQLLRTQVSTLILELPHREIGGKLTPWSDVLKMQEYCREHEIAFHCDGARLFEACAGYDEDMTLREMGSVFDSVYISFYKGLGGISGAMLLGSKNFCSQARVWLRRFGGNLYTLMPYIVSAHAGFERNWLLSSEDAAEDGETPMSFREKRDKLRRVVKDLQENTQVANLVHFDPLTPEVNMVHGYMRASVEDSTAALDQAAESVGIRALHRFRAIPPPNENQKEHMNADHLYYAQGYRTKFEWTMGEANGKIPDSEFLRGWTHFASSLTAVRNQEC